MKPLSLFHANAEEKEGNDEDADENDANQYDHDVNSQSDGYESAEDGDVCDGKDFDQMCSRLSMLAIFTITLTDIKLKKLFRRPYA